MASTAKLQGKGPIVLVDDSEIEGRLAERCKEHSKLRNPWLRFDCGTKFLDYIEEAGSATEKLPALVLLDLNMPEMSGFEILSKLKARHLLSNLPIVVLTNSESPADRKKALTLGARAYRVKPSLIQDYVEFFDSLD
ncbi:MAG: response regulator [Gammaproteobacteria bacterium]|nr:response regulator [Gammaproteobacteria bacterium]